MIGFFIDANLLLLLVVGSEGRELIAKHRRLRQFTIGDYDILGNEIARTDRVFVTPNTLTETSNLLAQHADPEKSRLFDRFRFLIEESDEIVVASADASRNGWFTRLGLTDAVLLEKATPDTPLITVDLDLYLAASANGAGNAVNFNHLRTL